MLQEEVEDEITALSSIYGDSFTRIDEDKIRAIITPADEDLSREGETSRVKTSNPLAVDITTARIQCLEKCAGATLLYLEATLPAEYPADAIPEFCLSNLNNSHFSAALKQDIISSLQKQVLDTHCRAAYQLSSACDT